MLAIDWVESEKRKLCGFVDYLVAMLLEVDPDLLTGLPRTQVLRGKMRMKSVDGEPPRHMMLAELRDREVDLIRLHRYAHLLLGRLYAANRDSRMSSPPLPRRSQTPPARLPPLMRPLPIRMAPQSMTMPPHPITVQPRHMELPQQSVSLPQTPRFDSPTMHAGMPVVLESFPGSNGVIVRHRHANPRFQEMAEAFPESDDEGFRVLRRHASAPIVGYDSAGQPYQMVPMPHAVPAARRLLPAVQIVARAGNRYPWIVQERNHFDVRDGVIV